MRQPSPATFAENSAFEIVLPFEPSPWREMIENVSQQMDRMAPMTASKFCLIRVEPGAQLFGALATICADPDPVPSALS
jgi:hypothetical protein